MSHHIVGQATRTSSAMGPSVRLLLSQYAIDPNKITSTGPHKTLLKYDVLSYITENKPQVSNTNSSNKKHIQNTQPSYQPKAGPEGFSRVAKILLDMS